ncbi:hypothetical protein AB0C34_27950 [Nocardia sp. NPDC049220]|uniref:hypothetical protein n=1 Tax=Nocardia sp. NPDC049220 TaxID=3155273 RepID=UPI0033DDA3B0
MLLNAEAFRTDRHPITEDWPELDLDIAYQVQAEFIAEKVARGEQVIGIELALTSRAKQQRMGITSPLTAVRTDQMVLEIGVPIPGGGLIHPRVQPAIVLFSANGCGGPVRPRRPRWRRCLRSTRESKGSTTATPTSSSPFPM